MELGTIGSHFIKKNTFLGTLVPKSSIKVQFVPIVIVIRNLEQLVPFLIRKDHFVPFLYKNTFPCYQKEHIFKKNNFQITHEGTKLFSSGIGTRNNCFLCYRKEHIFRNDAIYGRVASNSNMFDNSLAGSDWLFPLLLYRPLWNETNERSHLNAFNRIEYNYLLSS